jgi:hypothetical protein
MKSRILLSCALALLGNLSFGQSSHGRGMTSPMFFADSATRSEAVLGSSSSVVSPSVAGRSTYVRPVPVASDAPVTFRPFTKVGIDWHSGLGGVGVDVATPIARKFNLRTGFDFFGYSTAFQEEGANVGINLRLRSGHASLDWFPFGGKFRVSPLLVFANNNIVKATAVIPSGSSVTLNGNNFVSDSADPLHGSGSVSFRKVSPGLSIGFGNIVPRTKGHVSFPVEAGFYYVGQPRLNVDFSGSACDPNYPPSIGCQSANLDAGFQKDLTSFIARNNNNLSYASLFPLMSVGVGFSF